MESLWNGIIIPRGSVKMGIDSQNILFGIKFKSAFDIVDSEYHLVSANGKLAYDIIMDDLDEIEAKDAISEEALNVINDIDISALGDLLDLLGEEEEEEEEILDDDDDDDDDLPSRGRDYVGDLYNNVFNAEIEIKRKEIEKEVMKLRDVRAELEFNINRDTEFFI